MKITNKTLKTSGLIIALLGIAISMFFDSARAYIIIGSCILGLIIMMPWVNEKESNSNKH